MASARNITNIRVRSMRRDETDMRRLLRDLFQRRGLQTTIQKMIAARRRGEEIDEDRFSVLTARTAMLTKRIDTLHLIHYRRLQYFYGETEQYHKMFGTRGLLDGKPAHATTD